MKHFLLTFALFGVLCGTAACDIPQSPPQSPPPEQPHEITLDE